MKEYNYSEYFNIENKFLFSLVPASGGMLTTWPID